MAGEQTIADQAHAAAVQMWQETGSGSGSRPRREDFDHLNEVPSPPVRLPELPPADPDEVQAALEQMQASSHGQITGRR